MAKKVQAKTNWFYQFKKSPTKKNTLRAETWGLNKTGLGDTSDDPANEAKEQNTSEGKLMRHK